MNHTGNHDSSAHSMALPGLPFPQPPAQIAPLVEVLGPELTVRFLLRFGGVELAIPSVPKGRSRLEALVGTDKVKALAKVAHLLPARVPLCNAWASAALFSQGMPVSEIARQVRISDVTVRNYVRRYRNGERIV